MDTISVSRCCSLRIFLKQWSGKAPGLLAETWFAANHPLFPYTLHLPVLRGVREIAKELGLLRALIAEKRNNRPMHISLDECRMLIESLLAQLQRLPHMLLTEKEEAHFPSLDEAFRVFHSEAKYILTEAVQCFNLPLMRGLLKGA